MRNLPPPGIDARASYFAISRSRRDPPRTRLLAADGAVFSAYDDYTAAAHDVTTLTATNTAPATRSDLTGNYRSRCKATMELKAALAKNNTGGRCPLCQVSTGTLDHYLPQQRFPEFAVFPLNLVPVCWRCNHRKREDFRDTDAIFLHAYLDLVPDNVRFLFAEVDVEGDAPVFSYRVDPPSQLGNLRDRVRSHFDKLDLASLYAVEAAHEYGARREELSRIHEDASGNTAPLCAYLQSAARSVQAYWGSNNWQYAALDAMASSFEFCRGPF
jgi:hypothetical protein